MTIKYNNSTLKLQRRQIYRRLIDNSKKLRYRRGTARSAMSVEVLSTAAKLYEI